MKYQTFTLRNFREIAQLKNVPEEKLFDVEVVGSVLPFKTNNYVVNELIDWNNCNDDPLFRLNFPQKEMLSEEHYKMVATHLRAGADRPDISRAANRVRFDLNLIRQASSNIMFPCSTEKASPECNTSTMRPCCFSPVRDKHAMLTVPFVSDGPNSRVFQI